MSMPRMTMERLQELVRLHRKGVGCREAARLLKMGPNTERQYRLALKEAGFLDGSEFELPSLEELKKAVQTVFPQKQPSQQVSSVSRWKKEIKQMYEMGSSPKAIYDCLRLENEIFNGSLWAVRRMCRRLKRARPVTPEDVVIPVETAPGEIAQVDFGYVGKLYDSAEGVLRKAWVFVMVLAYSRHMFCRIVFNQRTETWINLHKEAFKSLGGVVETIVPDNLKAAVIRAAFAVDKAAELNRSYREFAQHYGLKIDPTPIYSPEKKGKVEAGVKYVKNNFIKPRKFLDIDDANKRLDIWVHEIAGKRIHGTTGFVPLTIFHKMESSSLSPLPSKEFEPIVWKRATVHRDSRIMFDRKLYPVPWRFIGKRVWARASRLSLEIYCDDTRIAAHQRGVPVPREVYDSYLPEGRGDLRHRSKEYWLKRADAIGQEVGTYIREVFDLDDVLSLLRRVQSMIFLLEKYPQHRATAACRRATFYGNYQYQGLKNILTKGLDMKPLPSVVVPEAGALENPRFARKPSELLQLELEVSNEPN